MIEKHLLLPGTFLHNKTYRIDKKNGQGGFGITYLGTFIHKAAYSPFMQKSAINELFIEGKCVRENKAVSLQTLDLETFNDFKKRFRQEAEKLAQFQHDNILRLFIFTLIRMVR